MQSKWLGRVSLAALLVGVTCGSGLVGCAAERDPINRVQAGVVDKTFFLGADLSDFHDDPEFRTKAFNIDSGANTDNNTIGLASVVERVRWQVTENLLLARRSYQESPNADTRGLPREVVDGKLQFTTPPDGTVIAAYKIASHFDIRRDYNSQTGEQTNVIVENSTDRPWNERQFMRVDWSQNLADSTAGDDLGWIFGEGKKASPVAYAPTNTDDPDQPHFEIEGGYFDVTNKYTVTSEAIPGWGISECVLIGFFNNSTSFDCSPTEVKVRSSFVKLTGEEDFEPFEESKAPSDVVGNWGPAGSSYYRGVGQGPITTWDPQYGYTDANTKTFYSFHEIWQKSHLDVACDSDADGTLADDGLTLEGNNGTADQCEKSKTGYTGSDGSRCDIYTKKCTIPVRDRAVKTIAYWLNEDAPPELIDQASSDGKTVTTPGAIEENGATWNQLLKVAVASRREVECLRTQGGDRAECHAKYFQAGDDGRDATDMVHFGGWGIQRTIPQAVDKMEDGTDRPAFVSCHNPVREYDQPVCGKPGEKIRLGDIRKNYQIYWPYASRAGYGGVATVTADPTTGEMLGTTATTMMRSATFAAAQQRDIIQLALGDITADDVVTGAPATTYANSVKSGRNTGILSKAKTPEEMAAAKANLDVDALRSAMATADGNASPLAASNPVQAALRALDLKHYTNAQSSNIAKSNDEVNALISKFDSSSLKTSLTNKVLYDILGKAQDKSSAVYQSIAQFAGQDTTRINELFDRYQAYLGNKGVCFDDAALGTGSGSLYQASLAPYFKKLYGDLNPKERGEKIYMDLLREAVKGIAFHEIGHSLGLRHNFASSWDAMNYLPQYWQLRSNEGQAAAECKAARTGAQDTCMGPRYLDPLTDDEQGLVADEPRPGIEYFANTSTMEYQIERFGETAGAGLYDLHAMKVLYGRTLEAFDSAQVKNPSIYATLTLSQGISDNLIWNNGWGNHYTKLARNAKVFDPARDCRDATDEEKARAKWRVVHGKICSPSPKYNMAYEDMKSRDLEVKIGGQKTSVGADGVHYVGKDYVTGEDVYRWQYRYGEDYSSGGYMHAKMMDSGADVYEITANTIRKFDVTYPWQYFRRQNKEFAWWFLADRVASTFKRIRGYHWNTATDIGRAAAGDTDNDDRSRPSVMANAEMFRFLQRAILTPEPGYYADQTTRTPTRPGALKIFDAPDYPTEAQMASATQVGVVDGRFVQIDFDNTLGGSWEYQAFPKHVGYDMERVLAIRELVDSRPTLSTVSRENALDGRDPYISFRTDMPQALDRLIGGILAEDWETIAPSLAKDGSLANFDIMEKDPTKLVRPANTVIAFPNVGYSHEISGGIYTLLFSRFSTDMTLANKLRVRAEGDAGPTIPADRRLAFTDPNSGIRYLATTFGTETIQGRAVERGVASRVLQHANELLAAAYKVQLDPATQEPVLDANGEPTLERDGGGAPIVTNTVAEAKLRRYVGLVDGLRQAGNILGGGPLGGGGGGDDE